MTGIIEDEVAVKDGIDAAIIAALLSFGITAGKAKDITNAMSKGEIPHVKVVY